MAKVVKIIRANLVYILCMLAIIITLVIMYPIILDKVAGRIYNSTRPVDPWSQTGNWTLNFSDTLQNTTKTDGNLRP